MRACTLCGKTCEDDEQYCLRCGSGLLEEVGIPVEQESKEEAVVVTEEKTDVQDVAELQTREQSESSVVTTEQLLKLYGLFIIPVYGWYKAIRYALGEPNMDSNITNIVRANLVVFSVLAILLAIIINLMGTIVVRI